jgi:competence protein ComEC
MELWIWDVEHGLAACLTTPTKKTAVIDLGVGDTSTGDSGFSPLKHLMSQGITQLDKVIITHPHRDHLDDLLNFDALNPRVLARPRHLTEDDIRGGNQKEDSGILDMYLAIDQRYSFPVAEGADPLGPANAGMEIRTFHPTNCATSNLNNHSIITFLSFAESTICIPGDNEAPSWRELLEDKAFQAHLKKTDVLVAAHHGREAGYCEDIFIHCSPRLVCVSDGPGSDTSAVNKYYGKASGWTVFSRGSGDSEKRYVLTTRTDGSIRIKSGRGPDKPFLNVTIE